MGTFRKILLFLSGTFTGISGTCLVLSKLIAKNQGLTLREFWSMHPGKALEEIGLLENALDKNDVRRALNQPGTSSTSFSIPDKLREEYESSDTLVVLTEKIPDSNRFYSRIRACDTSRNLLLHTGSIYLDSYLLILNLSPSGEQ